MKAETSTAVPTAGTTLQTSLSGNTATIVNTVAGGLPTTQANIAAPTLRAGASTSSEPSSTSTREPTPSAGSAGAGGSGGGGGTSKTTIIAIAVSLGSIVVGIIGILVKVYLHKAEKKRKAEEAAAAAAAQPPVRNFRTKDYGY